MGNFRLRALWINNGELHWGCAWELEVVRVAWS